MTRGQGSADLGLGYLTGAVHADWVLKLITSGKNLARLENSGRVVAQGLVREPGVGQPEKIANLN